MEEVCLNKELVFDETDDFECEVSSYGVIEHEDGTAENKLEKEVLTPTVGLEFDSYDEAYYFYNVYAKEQGFGIRVSNSWYKSKEKERYRAKLSCSNAGFKKKTEANNPRPETRTGCPVMIVIKLVESKRWRIVKVELDHNHPVNPQADRFYKSHKNLILTARKAQSLKDPGMEVHTIKLYRTCLAETACHGYSNGDERESVNPADMSKHLELGDADATALYNYFCRMKLSNPNFFYLMDFDDNGRLRNVMWADARSRGAYGYFCDTVAIDTMCLTNKFEIPLILFLGVNHHGHPVLLGCGLLGHESAECFVWILKAWFNCMQGRSPQVIIIDQCKPLQIAVCEVFPRALQCFSLWYIMQRVPEKLGGLKGYEAIRRQLNKVIFKSLKIVEFETSWAEMIKHHGLGDNKWLQTLCEERNSWAPVYLKDVFFAGMIPIQENERFTPFFDGYVHKHTSIKEFLDKYELALHRKYLKEAVANLESLDVGCEVRTKCSFEMQLSKLYTKDIFRKFQTEVEGMFACFNTKRASSNGPVTTYVVKERVETEGSEKEVRSFEVLFETTLLDIRCICSLLNYKGYLCRHALNVLHYNAVEEIPPRYILQRWCKNYKCRILQQEINGNDECDPVRWYNQLYKTSLPVVEAGAESQEHCRIALHELEKLLLERKSPSFL